MVTFVEMGRTTDTLSAAELRARPGLIRERLGV
jgi:hypothetical protein